MSVCRRALFFSKRSPGSTWTYPIAVDGDDNIYYTREGSNPNGPSACTIVAQNQNFSWAQSGSFWRVAGTNVCGFSGDGGLATGAEISSLVEGFAWDAAGNFYFTDSGNNRVRRIDGATGIIRTIAGSGSAGYGGDGGQATTAFVYTPKGIAVDSFGNVYATSIVGLAGSTNMSVVREFGATGFLNFAIQAPTTSSPARTIMVSNVGNNDLNFTRAAFTSGNTGDFVIDPNTTSCNFTVPFSSGRNCLIGIIFTPAATGTRSAVLALLDDTVSGSNMIQLSGLSLMPATATPSATTLTFPLQTVGTTSASQSFTLSNTGGQTLNLSTYTFGGTNPSYFAQTHSCPGTLTINTGCTISVTFSPTATGSATATLTIATSVGNVNIALNGSSATAATATLSQTSLTFPSQAVGTSSAAQQVTLNNTGGTALTINSYTFTGANPTYFSQTNGCLATMPASSGCSIYVTFSPTAAGSPTATLSVSTSIGTKTVALSGTSTAGSAVHQDHISLYRQSRHPGSSSNPQHEGIQRFFRSAHRRGPVEGRLDAAGAGNALRRFRPVDAAQALLLFGTHTLAASATWARNCTPPRNPRPSSKWFIDGLKECNEHRLSGCKKRIVPGRSVFFDGHRANRILPALLLRWPLIVQLAQRPVQIELLLRQQGKFSKWPRRSASAIRARRSRWRVSMARSWISWMALCYLFAPQAEPCLGWKGFVVAPRAVPGASTATMEIGAWRAASARSAVKVPRRSNQAGCSARAWAASRGARPGGRGR